MMTGASFGLLLWAVVGAIGQAGLYGEPPLQDSIRWSSLVFALAGVGFAILALKP